MSHLTPVVRPDINGKMVTRHMKPAQGPATPSTSGIPSPQQKDPLEVIKNARRAFHGRNVLVSGLSTAILARERHLLNYLPDVLAKKVRALPDDLAELYERADSSISLGLERAMLCGMVIKCIDADISHEDIKSAIDYYSKSDNDLRDDIEEYFEVGDKKIPDFPIGNFISAVKNYSLDGFNFDASVSTVDQDPWTRKQCDAIRELHLAADKVEVMTENRTAFNQSNGTLLDDRLAQLVVDQPDAARDVTEIMIDRSTFDYDLVTSILNSDASAIRDGVL